MAEIEDEIGLCKAQCICCSIRPLLKHLISDAPHKDRRMVAVAYDEICQITLMPLVEITRIVISSLPLSPHIKRFILDNEAHFITKVKQFRSRRIVRGTDGVTTHFLEYLELTSCRILIEGRSKTSEIVMQAYAVYLHRLTVKRESLLGAEFEISEPHSGLIPVKQLSLNAFNLSNKRIKIRILNAPQMRFVKHELKSLGRCICNIHDLLYSFHLISIRIHEDLPEIDLLHLVIFGKDRSMHLKGAGIMTFGTSIHISSVRSYSYFLCLAKPHITIDSAS